MLVNNIDTGEGSRRYRVCVTPTCLLLTPSALSPKSGQKETDLTITKVIKIGYDYGLVESKTISIDSVWSAIKFTHPKEGKEYNNSYGKLR